MQPLSIQDTQQKVLTLNSEQNPFLYSVSGDEILGSWKIADVKWAVILGQGNIDKKYSLTVTLDEPTHTYTFSEQKTTSGSKLAFDPMTGNVSFGISGSTFRGKMSEKEFGWGTGTSVQQNGEPANSYKYSFDTKQIKEPLFSTLEQCGWTQKNNNLLSRLFKK